MSGYILVESIPTIQQTDQDRPRYDATENQIYDTTSQDTYAKMHIKSAVTAFVQRLSVGDWIKVRESILDHELAHYLDAQANHQIGFELLSIYGYYKDDLSWLMYLDSLIREDEDSTLADREKEYRDKTAIWLEEYNSKPEKPIEDRIALGAKAIELERNLNIGKERRLPIGYHSSARIVYQISVSEAYAMLFELSGTLLDGQIPVNQELRTQFFITRLNTITNSSGKPLNNLRDLIMNQFSEEIYNQQYFVHDIGALVVLFGNRIIGEGANSRLVDFTKLIDEVEHSADLVLEEKVDLTIEIIQRRIEEVTNNPSLLTNIEENRKLASFLLRRLAQSKIELATIFINNQNHVRDLLTNYLTEMQKTEEEKAEILDRLNQRLQSIKNTVDYFAVNKLCEI